MPIKFKNTPQSAGHSPITEAQTKARKVLGLPHTAAVHVGMTTTTVHLGGVGLTVPMGLADILTNSPAVEKATKTLKELFSALVKAPEVTTKVFTTPKTTDLEILGDEDWAVHVAQSTFPEVVALKDATDLYQRVHGTNTGSVYVTAFIGPTLRGAVRLTGNSLSMRFQTNHGIAPGGATRDALLRLGVEKTDPSRLTVHVTMSGSLSERPAEYRAVFGAFYAALQPALISKFPDLKKVLAK